MPSPIQIKRPDVSEDVRTLAALTGLPITDAIAQAVRAQLVLERIKTNGKLVKRLAAAEKDLAAIRRLPVVGPDLTDDDLYDEQGFPK
jgi:hypothetical protein